MKSHKILLVQTNYPGFLKAFESENSSIKNYLTLKKHWDIQMFGQGSFYSVHLNQMGWDSQEIIANSYLLQSAWMKKQKLGLPKSELPFTKYLPESIKNLIGSRSWIKEALIKQIEVLQPEVLYMHDLTLLTVDDIKRIRPYIKVLAGQIACPLPLDTRPLKLFDLIISSFPHYVKMFRSWGIDSEYLQWCFEPTVLDELKKGKKKYKVSFIGGYSSAHSQGNKIFEEVASMIPIDFWGYGAGSLAKDSPILKNYHGEIWGKQMYQVMRDSEIVINRHINVAGNIANNMRMFDVTGVGSLLLTDKKPNMKEFFDVGRECVTYSSPSDLIKKLKHYLKNKNETIKISKAGQKRTLRDHTYQNRMETLSIILKQYLVKKNAM